MKELTQTYVINAPVEKVWAALTTADVVEQWGAGPAKVDAREGGERTKRHCRLARLLLRPHNAHRAPTFYSEETVAAPEDVIVVTMTAHGPSSTPGALQIFLRRRMRNH